MSRDRWRDLTRPDDLFGQFCFVVGGFLFAYLLLKGQLIPRWMAWTGVITIGLQLLCVPLYVATMLPGKIVSLLWFPILLYEVPLGVWLILRGTLTTAHGRYREVLGQYQERFGTIRLRKVDEVTCRIAFDTGT